MDWFELGLGILTLVVGVLGKWQGVKDPLFWTRGCRNEDDKID